MVAWGDVDAGGDASNVPGLQCVVALHATEGAFLALRDDGRVVCWGDALCGADARGVQQALDDM